jgi:glycolate oxidase
MGTALEQLVATLGDAVRTDPVTCENYRFDWSRDPTAGIPIAVVRPSNAAEVQAAIRWAAEHRVPVVPRGAGSGLSGGSSAVAGGIVVSLERMCSIEIDVAARVAVVEAGAFNADVKAAAAEHGLWYPPDPSSYEICSIGGNIATNAGGLCCVKYGVTTDYVLGLDVVLPDGTLITLGGKRIKDVAGLSLLKLFIGSGGTLGIITRAILRLIPAQGPRSTLVAYFPTVQAAADTVLTIGGTLRASMMELMDQTAINAVEDYRSMGLDRSAGAMLIAQSDAPGAACAAEIEVMEAACATGGAKEVFITSHRGSRLHPAGRRRRTGATVAPIAFRHRRLGRAVRRRDSCGCARRRRQFSSDHRLRSRRPRGARARIPRLQRDHAPGNPARRNHHR